MTITSNNDNKNLRVVGTRPLRHDAVDKVTGRAKYGADIQMAGLLHGKILRSPHPHARIKRLDTTKAQALPGVKAVITAKDFPISNDRFIDFTQTMANPRMIAENVLASEKVLYIGHAVAAVAATDVHLAEEAASLIEVEYEILEPVFTVTESMKDSAPILHEELTTIFRVERFGPGEDTGIKSNIASQIQFKRGDIEQGFSKADVVVEREYTTKPVHQGYIEPHTSTGYWSPDGRLTIWTSTQGIFPMRSQTANILGIPESSIKVIPMEIGGGFGGKTVTYLDPVVGMLSKMSGNPVKIVMTRKEVFEGTGPTSGTYMWCKIGADKSGHITAAHLYLAFESGAFPGSPVGGGAMSGLGPYKIDNLIVDGLDVVVNTQKVAAYRAPGQPQAAFAVEPIIDELAEILGMDPLDFRILNSVHEGDRAPSGVPHLKFGCEEVEQAMKEHPHYTAPLDGPNQGRGVAVGYRLNGGGSGSSATINVNANGTINLITGSVDIGGSRTSIAMQAAEILGINAEDVNPSVVDTDSVGWTGATGGSRIAFDTGRAAILAAQEVLRQMSERASLLWEVKPEDIEFTQGTFTCSRNPNDSLTFAELASKLMDTGGPVTCSASDRQGGVGAQLAGHIVDVEVDPETGKVDILRYTTFIDAGKAAHPSYVEGQMQGGALQGIGWALNEEYYLTQEGSMANASFLDYRMPTSLDLPMIDTCIIEVENPRHPFGIRGVGETVLIPPMAAIANAIHQATGVRMDRLPMSPGAILTALGEK